MPARLWPAVVEAAEEKVGGYVVKANMNSRMQTVIAGASDAIDKARALIDYRRIEVDAKARTVLARIPLGRGPAFPIFSPDGSVARFEWDTEPGRLLSLTNGMGQSLRFRYDAAGRLVVVVEGDRPRVQAVGAHEQRCACSQQQPGE